MSWQYKTLSIADTEKIEAHRKRGWKITAIQYNGAVLLEKEIVFKRDVTDYHNIPIKRSE